MIKLYHGTNIDFDSIDLNKCRPNKDFGKGFYLTHIRKQAEAMAIRRCEFEGHGNPTIQTYIFDESLLHSNILNVKIFENVSKEWAEFILKNRKAKNSKTHNYDIVVGPVADDGVVLQLNLYQRNLITLDKLVEELTFSKLSNQYLFATEVAISKLKRL